MLDVDQAFENFQKMVESINFNLSESDTRVKIIDVIENPANPHFVRRGIITKGTTIETELGLARVTSRPSQHAVVSAVLLEKEKKE